MKRYTHTCTHDNNQKWSIAEGTNCAQCGWAAPVASQSTPVAQEPVAWMYSFSGRHEVLTKRLDHYFNHEDGSYVKGTPLYAAPTTAQGLTDAEIDAIAENFSNEFGLEAKHTRDFARAILSATRATKPTEAPAPAGEGTHSDPNDEKRRLQSEYEQAIWDRGYQAAVDERERATPDTEPTAPGKSK